MFNQIFLICVVVFILSGFCCGYLASKLTPEQKTMIAQNKWSLWFSNPYGIASLITWVIMVPIFYKKLFPTFPFIKIPFGIFLTIIIVFAVTGTTHLIFIYRKLKRLNIPSYYLRALVTYLYIVYAIVIILVLIPA